MQIIQTQIAHRKLDKPVSWILNGFSDNAQLLTKEIQWFVVILQIIQIQIAHKKLEKTNKLYTKEIFCQFMTVE